MISRLDRYLMKIEEFILSYSVILIFVMVAGNVLSRVITKNSWSFSAEVSQFAVIIATFMGISYAARKGRHIRMSAFFDLAPQRVKKFLAIMISAVTAFVLLVLAYYSFEYVLWTMNTGRVTTALQVPAYFMAIFLPIGFVLGALQYFRNVWINIKEDEIYIGTEKLDFSEKETDNDPKTQAQII
ncbi:TRAP transporter small permease [Bacillaceae bacterium IKA-2]|nr:TRAP transporter small permease [Bacillaceae bacterium IKA-2]